MAKPPVDPRWPDYTSPPPSGTWRGRPAPTEQEFGGGDDFYGQTWRHEQDNNGSRDRRTARQPGNMMDPFSKFMDGLEYEARERGLKGEARKAHIANGIQTFRDRLYDDLEQRLSMLQERTAAYEGDGVGEELDAMDDPEMNPQGETGYTREMQMNYSRGAPGGAEIARNDMRNRAVDERYFQQGDRTLTNPRTQGFSAAAGPMMDQRRDAELLANARDTYDGQPIPYDDFGTGDMLMRLKKRRPGGLIGGSGPR